MYFDRTNLSGTQLTSDTFSVTVDTNSTTPLDGFVFKFFIEQKNDKSKFVTGQGVLSLGATVFTILTGYESSNGSGNMVTFTGEVRIASAVTARDLNTLSKGRMVNALTGQSNIIGLNEDSDDRDFIYSNNIQYSRANAAPIGLTRPLKHQGVTVTRQPTNLSYATSFGNKLVDIGHRAVLFSPSGVDSSGFTSPAGWNPDGVGNERLYYDGAVQDCVDALNDDPDNYPGVILLRIGETDYANGVTEVQFRDFLVRFFEQFRIDVGALVQQDVSKMPGIIIGLNQAFIDNNLGALLTVEPAMEDAPNYVAYTSYLSLQTWSTSGDGTHDDGDTVRRVGAIELPPKILEAQANRSPSGAPAKLSGTATCTATASSELTVGPAKLSGTATCTATASGNLAGSAAQLSGTATCTATATGNLTEEQSSDAPAPVFLIQRGVAQTDVGGNLETWGSTVDAAQIENLIGSFRGPLTSGYLDFLGNSVYNFNPGLGTTAMNSAVGYTIIFDVEPDTVGNGEELLEEPTVNHLDAGGAETYIQGTQVTWPGMTASTRQQVALTIDRGGDFAKVFVDGVEVGVTNGLAALTTTGDNVGDQGLGATGTAYNGKLYNLYIANVPMTSAQCIDANATYFIT